jgi:hypothetical protein
MPATPGEKKQHLIRRNKMNRKIMLATVLIGLMIALSGCGSKPTNAPAAASPATSPASTTSSTTSSATSRPEVNVTGKWELVGKEGDYRTTVGMVAMDNMLWTVQKDGSLYKVDPSNGASTKIADKGSFEKLENLEGMDHMLWSVESGTLYKNDSASGKWEQVGKEGEWARTVDFVGLNGFLYSIEPDGSLWKTDKTGNHTLLDKGEFKGCTHLTEMGGNLYTIENGTLYETDPNTLKWRQIGKEGDFARINAMEGTMNYIFMIDKSGILYKVDKDGTATKLGDDYGETTILTTLNGKLWTIEGGSLYKTS